MFKKTLIAMGLSLATIPALANETDEPKRFSVGIASFATITNIDTYYGSADEDFSGFALLGTAAVNDNVAFRLTYANQSHEDDSNLDLTAIEGSVIAGMGLSNTGFKAYGSLGFFNETLEYSGFSEEFDFNGFMLGGGIGYNWNPVALEFWINFRDASDYEDFFGDNADVTAASGGLALSARF